MAIELMTKDGLIGLIATCDRCGEKVDADSANVIWAEMNNADGEKPQHYIGCRENGCSRIIKEALKKESRANSTDKMKGCVGMISLDAALIQLEHNVKLDRKTAKRAAERIAMIS
jgi:hypothetical protein